MCYSKLLLIRHHTEMRKAVQRYVVFLKYAINYYKKWKKKQNRLELPSKIYNFAFGNT